MSSAEPYLVAFILEAPNFVWPRDPFAMGAYEFTRRPDSLPGCELALAASMSAHKLTVSNRIVRVQTFITSESRAEAIRTSRLHAKETLSLMSTLTYQHVGSSALSKAGYTHNLSTGVAEPLLPADYRMHGAMGMMAMLDEHAVHPEHTLNMVLSTHQNQYGELGMAVRRSTHWRELAELAEDAGERILMRWMAAETLTRTEDETLTPKFLSALGFATGTHFVQLPQSEQDLLTASEEVRNWRKLLTNLLERLRDCRNQIAHAGFREIELRKRFNQDEWRIVGTVLVSLVGRLQYLAFNGLALGVRSVQALWERYGECMMHHRSSHSLPLAQDLEGNLIFRLKQAPFPGEQED